MSIFDTGLLIILGGFAFYGFYLGLIRTFGSIISLVAGAWVASHYYLIVSGWVESLFFGYNNLGKVVVFLLLFSLANRLVNWAFALVDGFFDLISIIPFLKTINRLAGAALGLILGGLIVGLILYVCVRYPFLGTYLGKWLEASEIAPYLIKLSTVLTPLLPEVLKKVQSLI